jgi:hypothetical protein
MLASRDTSADCVLGPVSHTELALTDKWKGMRRGNQGHGEGTKEEEERTDVGEARRPNAIT